MTLVADWLPSHLYKRMGFLPPLVKMKIEGRVESIVTAQLVKRGHLLKVVEDYIDIMGHAGAILIDPVTNIKYGGVDSRKNGSAVGY